MRWGRVLLLADGRDDCRTGMRGCRSNTSVLAGPISKTHESAMKPEIRQYRLTKFRHLTLHRGTSGQRLGVEKGTLEHRIELEARRAFFSHQTAGKIVFQKNKLLQRLSVACSFVLPNWRFTKVGRIHERGRCDVHLNACATTKLSDLHLDLGIVSYWCKSLICGLKRAQPQLVRP